MEIKEQEFREFVALADSAIKYQKSQFKEGAIEAQKYFDKKAKFSTARVVDAKKTAVNLDMIGLYSSMLLAQIYARNPKVAVNARTKAGERIAQYEERILNYYMEELDIHSSMRVLVQDAFVTGMGIGKDGLEGQQILSGEEQHTKAQEWRLRPYLSTINPTNWFIDPMAVRGIDAARFCGEVFLISKARLQENKAYNQDIVAEYKPNKLLASEYLPEGFDRTSIEKLPDTFKLVPIVELHIKYKDSVRVLTYIKDANIKQPLRYDVMNLGIEEQKENPFQYETLAFQPSAQSFYPQRRLDLWRTLQDVFNELISKSLDFFDRLRTFLIIDKGLVSKDQTDKLERGEIGSIIFAEGDITQAMRAEQSGRFPPEMWSMLNFVIGFFGKQANIAPAGISEVGTATQAELLSASHNVMVADMVMQIERMFKKRCRKLLRMILRYGEQLPLRKILGGADYELYLAEIERIKKEGLLAEIRGEYTIDISGGSTIELNKTVRRKQMLEFFQILAAEPLRAGLAAGGERINFKPLLDVMKRDFEVQEDLVVPMTAQANPTGMAAPEQTMTGSTGETLATTMGGR